MRCIPVESGLPDAKEALLVNSTPAHVPLPVESFARTGPDGSVTAGRVTVSRWTLDERERMAVLRGDDVYVTLILPEDYRHPPIALSVGGHATERHDPVDGSTRCDHRGDPADPQTRCILQKHPGDRHACPEWPGRKGGVR